MKRLLCIAAAALLLAAPARATEWIVGPGRPLSRPSQAAALARDGDTVTIEAGSYVDCATWRQHNLLLRATGGFAHLRDTACGGKALWIIQGDNTVVEGIEFSGAAVVDKNGAGIRQEGTNLTVLRCSFHDSQEGILTGANPASRIRIEHSVFDNNGYGDGYSHNMYIGHVGCFEIVGCWTHRARVGHNIKSRADTNRILYNRISNEADGTASRDIDLPNGGWTLILGNVLQHGPATQNSNLCGYGMEGLSNPSRTIAVAGNTFVTQRGAGTFVQLPATGTDTLRLYNNLFVGAASPLSGTAAAVDSQANLLIRAIADARFADAAAYDYRLTASSPAVDAGVDAGPALQASMQYVHPAGLEARPRAGALDAGAFEFVPATDAGSVPPALPDRPALLRVFPNPCSGSAEIEIELPRSGAASLALTNALGARVALLAEGSYAAGRHRVRLSAPALPPGLYWLRLLAPDGAAARPIVVR